MHILKRNLRCLLNYELKYRLYSTAVSDKSLYSSSVLLPSTQMPLRLETDKLIHRDTQINKIHDKVYKWQNDNFENRELFVLHDGPPYANGAPHMGHAINKILKDTVIRTRLLQGNKINYIPGWDCHGLPIELKAVKQVKNNLGPIEIRQKARSFAMKTIENQKAVFQSWGVIGDWENSYKTFDKAYIKNQLLQFYRLYEQKFIYRDVKPVYWSPSSKTALAEAELEYNPNHVSTALTVRLKIQKLPEQLKNYEQIYALIWTTTPWSLPGNQAVCYNKELSYSLVKHQEDKEIYLIATDLISSYSNKMQREYQILETFNGDVLTNMTYYHPIYHNELPFFQSSHATSTKGTGLVHTAPAHGPEDFLVALEKNIKIKCLVDENGKYIPETGKNLEGISVLDKGNETIINLLGSDVTHKEDLVHSYPYDWRTNKPVILRASQQWFIDMNLIKNVAIEYINNTNIIPQLNGEKYKKNLIDQLKKRPYWCISRQRCWGVPIPVFYDKPTGKPLLNKAIVDHLCTILDETDADFWWNTPIDKLFPPELRQELNVQDITKGEDILDIWFDSGLSWSSVLPKPQIADMYLEGVDQFTGWFQSSLITSVALRNLAPYKSIYVHGFALDEKGIKMSKSLGNVIDPQEIMKGSKKKKPFGVDTLRWWVACHANQDTTTLVSDNVLKASADEVQKIRSTLRFALGSLYDYKYDENLDYKDLRFVDKYMLHLLYNYNQKASEFLDSYQFHKLCPLIINFTANEISAVYYMMIKDRLYCDEENSHSRLSAQFVLYQLLQLLVQSIAPIVPHLAEEIHLHLPASLKTSESFFMQNEFPIAKDMWNNEKIDNIMNLLLDVRKEINKLTGNASAALESHVELFLTKDKIDIIKDNLDENDLCDILSVAEVDLLHSEVSDFQLNIKKSEQYRCPRCRKHNSLTPKTLCNRCYIVMDSLKPMLEINN